MGYFKGSFLASKVDLEETDLGKGLDACFLPFVKCNQDGFIEELNLSRLVSPIDIFDQFIAG
jgi:hypothetical protein